MKARLFASVVVAAGLAGCATDYVPPRPSEKPGPEYDSRQAWTPDRGAGLFGDLTWSFDTSGKVTKATPAAAPATPAEQEDFKKWKESASASERSEFEEWRAWQEWKKKNPQ